MQTNNVVLYKSLCTAPDTHVCTDDVAITTILSITGKRKQEKKPIGARREKKIATAHA